MNQQIGRILVITGAAAITAGLFFIYGGRLPLLKYLGKLPGDIRIQKESFSFYFPVTTCILLSLLVTILFRLTGKLK